MTSKIRQFLRFRRSEAVYYTAILAFLLFASSVLYTWFERIAFSLFGLPANLFATSAVSAAVVLSLLIHVPKYQARQLRDRGGSPEVIFEAENNARRTLAQILGGAFFLGTLYFTWQGLQVSRETEAVARQSEITDRLTKATEQLGNDKEEVRVAGIYSLGGIANEDEERYRPIMEVLTAFVRGHAPLPADSLKKCRSLGRIPPAPCVDIQAAVSVISHSKVVSVRDLERLDLSHTDLRGADFRIWRYFDTSSDVNSGFVYVPKLRRSLRFSLSTPTEVYTAGGNLTGIDFRGANLAGADLRGADLRSADLQDATLTGAQLEAARLSNREAFLLLYRQSGKGIGRIECDGDALGLTQAQIKSAHIDDRTVLPCYLSRSGTETPEPITTPTP